MQVFVGPKQDGPSNIVADPNMNKASWMYVERKKKRDLYPGAC